MIIELSHRRLKKDGIVKYAHQISYKKARSIYVGDIDMATPRNMTNYKIEFQTCIRNRGQYKDLKKTSPPSCPPELYGGCLSNRYLAYQRWEMIAEMYLDGWTAKAIAERFGMMVYGVRQALKKVWKIEPPISRMIKAITDVPEKYIGEIYGDKITSERDMIIKKLNSMGYSVGDMVEYFKCDFIEVKRIVDNE
jgi:hypothetical protein